jgi:hypothetical protein
MKRHRIVTGMRGAALAAVFGGGFLCGSLSQRPAEAQLGEMGGKTMEKLGGSGGVVGAAANLGTAIADMQKHVEGLQKNLDTFKQVKAALGG